MNERRFFRAVEFEDLKPGDRVIYFGPAENLPTVWVVDGLPVGVNLSVYPEIGAKTLHKDAPG